MCRLVMLAVLLCVQLPAAAGVNTGLVGDDVTAGPFPIGFAFKYYGNTQTQFYATTNGLVQFSSPTTAYSNGCLPSLPNTILAFWDDLRTNVSGQPSGKIEYQTIGVAPNRKLVVQWTNQFFYGSNLPMGTFQVVLFESTNEIKLQYRYLREVLSTGGSATIGIQGPGSQSVQLSCNTPNVIVPEQAVSFTPDASGLNYQMNTAAPYDFIDISGLTPEPPSVAARFVKTAPRWSWARIPELTTYQIEIQTDAGELVRTETVGDVGSYTWTEGFEPGKTYRARVRGSVNNGGTWELWSGLSDAITIDQVLPAGQMLPALQVGPTSVEWRFSASDALSGVDTIRLQLASDPAFDTLVLDQSLSAGSTSYTFAGAVPGQRLYGRIRVTDKAGNTIDSTAVDLLILPPPSADFTPSTLSGEAPLDVSFQNATTGSATSWLWNFGDGRTSTAASPALRFRQPGTYTVVLRATGVGGYTEATRVVTVTPDVTVPAIGPLSVNGVPAGATLSVLQNTLLTFTASDANDLQSVTATLSGQAIALTNLGNGSYRLAIDPLQFANGTYTLVVTGKDTVGNEASAQLEVLINLPPPAAPAITAPAPNLRTNQPSLTVSGSTLAGTEAQLLLNGVAQGEWVPVANGRFTGQVTLAEGANRISAVVRNNRGSSTPSAEVLVTLNTSKPNGPTGLNAVSQAQGKVRLTWTASTDASSVGNAVYRSASPFESAAQATRLGTTAAGATSFEDIPAADGTYHYRVASVNDLGTLSTFSNSVQGSADSTAPRALSIFYTSLGRTDPATGRMGQGRVDLVATLSEPLLVPPYLSIVPQGGTPIPVELSKTGETTYAGSFLIDANTPSGTANALFSARDAVGNRGTDISAGATLKIETDGPALSNIVINPVAPIRNDSAQAVTATFTFSKAPAAVPQVRYLLSGPVRTPVALGTLAQVNPTTYSGSFTLPADAGLGSPEALSFSMQARDDLDNVSTKVLAFNRFQVYQGELPPLNVPFALTAKAQPGGKIKLTWQAVDEASAYQLYRQAPGQDTLQPLVRAGGVDYVDQTSRDGLYKYTIATVRASNGQESVSGQSAPVEATAIANGPGAPQNLALQVTGQGIYATWQAPLASNVDYYNLYRASGSSIASIDGLSPLKTRIKNPVAYDTSPSPAQGAYVVTAVDAAGNESAISNSAYLNASLLPVRQLKVEQIGNALPVISWTAPNGNVAGYLVYVGPDNAKVKLTPNPIGATTLTDTGYTAGERRYTVASVDANGVELPRSLVLPRVSTQIAAGLPIKRGMMNKLQVQVANTSGAALGEVRVVVRLPIDRDATQFKDHKSEPFALGPNETRLVPVIVGGYADLAGAPLAQVGVEIVPDEDGLVRIAANQSVEVTEGALVVGMATDEFTRGGTGKLKLTIENTGEVDVELLTATANGAGNSSELRFKLLDADGNVLATQPYKQVFGANVVTLPNGQTVARIPAGSSYVSDVFEVNVPGSSPNSIRVRLEVDKLRYHTGQPDEVQIAGRGSERGVSLVDTAYVGDVTEVSPISSFGDQDVVITGRALDRANRAPLGNTRLKLILNQQGFERSFQVITDSAGNFVYTFKPTVTDAGLYKVSAVHPSITDRPEQKAFTINRVTVGPTPFRIDVPKNYPFTVPFTAKAGAGTAATDLRLTLDAASQPTGQVPAGIHVQLPPPVTLAERQTLNVPVVFSADNDAQPSGSLIFDVVSAEHPATPLGQVTLSYQLSEAKPFLVSTPSFVETGLAQGSTQVETVTLKNNGLQEALNLRLSLTRADGSPAPAWAAIASQANGTLDVGASRPVDLNFMPPADLAAGVYEFRLAVEADNLPPQAINVYVSLSQSGQGNVLFKAADIYTATVGKDGNLIAGLAGASITLQNEDVPTISHELVTDSLGEALFQNIPAGSYKFRARAANHQEAGGRLLIKPGITANQSLFLDYNLITVEWSVREISIQDRYEITLNATFETDVPAAVVVMQPASVNLPKMNVGDVYYGELTLTNYGLIRADNVKQQLPASDGMFRYEFLVDVPPALAAKQRITVPYRVVALQALDGSSSTNASGGGCYNYSNLLRVTCDFRCANGSTSACGASTAWFSASNSSCPGGGGGGSWGGWAGWGGAGGSGGSGSTTIKLPEKKCVYVPKGGTKCD